MLVYEKDTGRIIVDMPRDQNYKIFFYHYPHEYIDNLDTVDISLGINANLDLYKVINKHLIKRDKNELNELRRYGKTLTEEERQLNKLIPSNEDIKKAEQTIEILTLIQEVI